MNAHGNPEKELVVGPLTAAGLAPALDEGVDAAVSWSCCFYHFCCLCQGCHRSRKLEEAAPKPGGMGCGGYGGTKGAMQMVALGGHPYSDQTSPRNRHE